MLSAFLRHWLAAGVLAAAALGVQAQQTPVPPLTGHVVDLTATLDGGQRAALDAKLAGFESKRGSQVVVLLVPTLGDETIEDFAGRVTDQWKLGRKGVDDGVLFVVAKNDHKLRIHTGRGVQGTLTDALSKRIVADLVAPHFRSGDFAGGIDAGADAIMKAIEGESLPLPERRAASHNPASGNDLLYLGFILVPIAGLVLRGIFGRFFGATVTSGLTAVVVWFVIGSLGIAIVVAVLAFLFTLISGSGIGRAVGGGGWGGGYIPGGWGGGGGGGGGGFSGGGGSFDGGGASGSW